MGRRILLVSLAAIAALAIAAWLLFLHPQPLPVTTNSEQAYSWYKEGLENGEKFFWAEASEAFEKATEADSTFAMAWVELAIACRNMEDSKESNTALEKAYSLRGQVSEIEQLYIDYFYDIYHHKYDEAKTVLEEMTEKYPDDIRSVLIRARSTWSLGDTDEAIRLYEKSLAIDPTKVMSHNQLGYLYLEKGDYQTAIANLRRYAYYAENQPNPHDSLGEAYEAAGKYDKAIEEYLKALEIRPSFYHSALHLASALAITGQVERARYTVDQAEAAMKEQGVNTRYLAVQRMRIESLGMHPEKVVTISDAELASIGDTDSTAYSTLLNTYTLRTVALLQLGRLDEAEIALEKTQEAWDLTNRKVGKEMGATGKTLGVIVGGLLRAMMDQARGRDIRALAAEVAKTIDDDSFPPHRNAYWRHDLGRIYYKDGDYDLAMEQTDDILKTIPTFPYMNLLAAETLAKLGRKEKALDHLAVYLQVMSLADKDHKGVERAHELLAELRAQ